MVNTVNKNGILVMAKRPFPGQTKTRLSPPLTPLEAAKLYECFLKDVLAKVQSLSDVAPYVAYVPETAESYFKAIAPNFGLILQQGDTLGERLDTVMTQCQAFGHTRVVAMNSDSPNLPISYLTAAFEQLADPAVDLVLGPCADGGYYLIGWKRPIPRLVRDVQMSTPHVLADTLQIAEQLGVQVTLLPQWYDVDSEADLEQLKKDLENNPKAAEHTALFFNTNM